MTDKSDPGGIYAEHEGDLLAAEYDRRKVLEARGDSIIKTSSGVIALIFALTIFISGKDYTFTNHWGSVWVIVASLAAFLASATIAIYLQSWGLKYTITGKSTLDKMTQEFWHLDAENAERMCLQRNINTTLSLRDGNDRKASAAQYSVMLQVVAVVLLSVSLVFELTGRHAQVQPATNSPQSSSSTRV